jgi:hypothetical protein
MTTTNTALAAKEADPRFGNRADGLDKGPIILITTIYTMLGTEAANDLVNIAKIPARCRPIPELSHVIGDGIATTATLDVGDTDDTDAADPDRYADGLNVAAAGTDQFSGGVASLTPYTTQKECWLQGKFATMNTPVAGKKLTFKIAVQVLQ